MNKLLGNLKRGIPFVLSAPAGTGKTTLAKRLYAEFPGVIVPSVSCTTRERRQGEVDGVDYHFLTEEAFMQKGQEFLESAEVFGKRYGTLKSTVDGELKAGRHVLLVIDTQGAQHVRKQLEGVFIFIAPPSLAALRTRLEKRGSESPESLERRLSWAQQELEASKNYDYIVVNDDLEIAYSSLKSIIVAEEHRSRYQYGLLDK